MQLQLQLIKTYIAQFSMEHDPTYYRVHIPEIFGMQANLPCEI